MPPSISEAPFQAFSYASPALFRADLDRLSPDIPFAASTSPLATPLAISGAPGGRVIPNRLAVHPMEGADGLPDGTPGELTLRRYQRFAAGGAGLLWFEATAVMHEGRANPRQLYLHKNNADAFKRLLEAAHAAAAEAGHPRPYTVLQLTHSGRQSMPNGTFAPIIAWANPLLDKHPGRVVTDDELKVLRDHFVAAANMAAAAGFDAVDIKASHGYLLGELLGARLRPGAYGGDFAGRTRLMLEIVEAIRAETGPGLGLASRYGVFDHIPAPYGWGVSEADHHEPDLAEPLELARLLHARGMDLFDITCGNPYYNPHVNRPFDRGFYTPPEHPMIGAARLLRMAKAVTAALPGAAVIATGLSWYRQYGAHVAAGLVDAGWCALAGFGRQAFAYPNFAADILQRGALDPQRCCVACGNCTVIMRDGGRSGCMVRDKSVYLPIYRQGREGKPPLAMGDVAEHI